MKIVRDLDDLADLNNMKSKDGKYQIIFKKTAYKEMCSLTACFLREPLPSIKITIIEDEDVNYFNTHNIIGIINILKDLDFDVEYEKDNNSKVAVSLINLAAYVNLDGSNIEEKIDDIKNIARRLEKIKWNK